MRRVSGWFVVNILVACAGTPRPTEVPPTSESFTVFVEGTIERSSERMSFVASDEVHSGDRLHLFVRSTMPAFVQVAYCNSAGELSVYPTVEDLMVTPDQGVRLPQRGALRIDDHPGKEVLYVIAARQRIDQESSELADKLRRARGLDAKEPCGPYFVPPAETVEPKGTAGPAEGGNTDNSTPHPPDKTRPSAPKTSHDTPASARHLARFVRRGMELEESSADVYAARSDASGIAIVAFQRLHHP